MPETSGPILRVVSGFHAGATCALDDGPVAIGQAPGSDIILDDDGVAPRHVELAAQGNDLRVTVHAPGVVVEDTEVGAGETVLAGLPVRLTLGGVEIRCDPPLGELSSPDGDAPPQIRRPMALLPRSRAGRAVGFGAMLALVVGFFTVHILPGGAAPKPVAVAPVVAAPGPSTAMLRDATTQEVATLKLSGLTLDAQPGLVVLGGTLLPADAARLTALQHWFDGRFGAAAMLVSNVQLVAPPTPSIPLEAVWDGTNPNIVVHDRTYFVGGALPDGTVVEAIGAHSVTLRQGGNQFAMEY